MFAMMKQYVAVESENNCARYKDEHNQTDENIVKKNVHQPRT